MTLQSLKTDWQDTPEYHKHIHELFIELVNSDPELNEHRTFIENNVYGMGERSFQWFWKLLVDELPTNFKFLEIGVHKAQILSLVRLLANRLNKPCEVFGITPMDGTGTGWTEDDYEWDIIKLHDKFRLRYPTLFKGLSTEPGALAFARLIEQYDVLYIDGSHEFSDALFDLNMYTPMIKSGGWLVMDDAACRMSMPFGYFQGIQPVCDALAKWDETQTDFEFQFNVVHLMIYKRK